MIAVAGKLSTLFVLLFGPSPELQNFEPKVRPVGDECRAMEIYGLATFPEPGLRSGDLSPADPRRNGIEAGEIELMKSVPHGALRSGWMAKWSAHDARDAKPDSVLVLREEENSRAVAES